MYEIEYYSKHLLDEAISRKVTDLHFIPEEDHYVITYRFNGIMEPRGRLPLKMAERLISHFKYRSGMDIGERRKPQSASMIYKEQSSLSYSLRLSTLPSREKESLAIRILPNFSLQTFSSLSILRNQAKNLESITSLTHGLCLVSGPTGSGKTTTLYTIVESIIKKGGKRVITIEDPVERNIDNAIQIEVNSKTGITFDYALKATLRHDPDVILVGEIRDEVTAKIAIRAALTGHLVLATVHANDCYSALVRMRDLGASQLDLIQCCRYVLSQRIVTTKCPYCIEECLPVCARARTMSRAAVFELLEGIRLKKSLMNESKCENASLVKQARKAWALGYLQDKEVLRFVANTF
ncbi:competence type IV pilus ATPase ComGA [Halalkalibacter alkaliphilus]|uniref:Flp pilus assembly complex ATPase component TadA n=1 Tax=Halalkalibacter alkaliphilus TaxID=2917993 RepID=A0A9X2I7C9_9BACI|nr:competence type IV pilus ATPase ComGA [Halalkalibacter alkaliphilus]MCL7749123.1 Flp pilus assembly complex ATPase component TadA [Halalkalibacter alkaliphilus]